MLKKMLFIIAGSFMLMSCKPESGAGKTAETKQEAKKSVEIKFDFSDFEATSVNAVLIGGQSIKINVKNITSDPKEIEISMINMNGSTSFYSSAIGPDKMNAVYETGNLIIMGEGEENIWMKFFSVDETNQLAAKELKFPMLVTIPVRDIKTGKTTYVEVIVDKTGKILFEKVSNNLNDYHPAQSGD